MLLFLSCFWVPESWCVSSWCLPEWFWLAKQMIRNFSGSMRWTSSFIEMTGLPSLCGCACFQRTRKYCWPSPRGSDGSSGTTAGSELEVWKFCCCSPPPVPLIRPSIRSSAAGRPTCCLCRRETEKPRFSVKSSGAAGNKELQRRECDSRNNSNVCSLMPILKLNRTRVQCQRVTGASFLPALTPFPWRCSQTESTDVLLRGTLLLDWTGLDWTGAAGLLEPGKMKAAGSPEILFWFFTCCYHNSGLSFGATSINATINLILKKNNLSK